MSNTHYFEVSPVDTWFFRDGRPMEIEQGVHAVIESTFPPSAQTVVGAMRAAISRANGWSGRGNWSDELRKVLGTYEDLGDLSFIGPHILCGRSLCHPMPLNVLGMEQSDGTWLPRTLLKPGDPMRCDLGDAVRLPQAEKPEPGLKNGHNRYITEAGLESVLRGDVPHPNDVIEYSTLFAQESRIGLARDSRTRSAIQGALYSTVHTRLKESVSLCVGVSGLPESWEYPSGLLQVGGEARMAELSPMSLDSRTAVDGSVVGDRCALVLLTPADFGEWEPLPGVEVPGLDGLILESCCIERPYRIGGWCSVRRAPLPRRPLYPAGSVLYCSIKDGGKAASDAHKGMVTIGERSEYGFGLAAIGSWTD